MNTISNPTPHERVALCLAQDLVTFGADARAGVIRARVSAEGIGDDLSFRTTLTFAGFSAAQITESLRRVHAELNHLAVEPRSP